MKQKIYKRRLLLGCERFHILFHRFIRCSQFFLQIRYSKRFAGMEFFTANRIQSTPIRYRG